MPTCISPGIGQSSKRDAHLGLGGAATGLGALAKPGREMTGGGAFGIPGYAGIGAASMVWGQHDEFDVLTDLPATVETVQSCALSHHPLRPLLLVGSSNTHVYLWEVSTAYILLRKVDKSFCFFQLTNKCYSLVRREHWQLTVFYQL